MNMEEAINIFRGLVSIAKTNTNPTMSVCNVKNDVFVEVYQCLLSHQPDPITGLVPCGCGGKAAYESDDMVEFRAFCTECEMHTDAAETKEKAKELWNRAMSGGACSHEN